MPNRSVFIRKNDLVLWEAQSDKSAMVAWALRNYPKSVKVGPAVGNRDPHFVGVGKIPISSTAHSYLHKEPAYEAIEPAA